MRRRVWILMAGVALCVTAVAAGFAFTRRSEWPPTFNFLEGSAKINPRGINGLELVDDPKYTEIHYVVHAPVGSVATAMRAELPHRGWTRFGRSEDWGDSNQDVIQLQDGRYVGGAYHDGQDTIPRFEDRGSYCTVRLIYSIKPPATWLERLLKRFGI